MESKDRCEQCNKELTDSNCTAIQGTCDDCLADQAAEDNYSYHSGEY